MVCIGNLKYKQIWKPQYEPEVRLQNKTSFHGFIRLCIHDLVLRMHTPTYLKPTRHVARIWKRGGGGLFWKSEKSANDLDPNFHCSWIRITRFVRKLRGNFSESSEIRTFFPPKNRWSKKKVFTEIETDFSAKIGNPNVFSAQKQAVSKKKKKKVFTEIETDFSAKIGNSNVLSGRITTCTSQLRHPISFGGGCFQFFTKNRPQKHQKRAILHTSQANRERLEPPQATLLKPTRQTPLLHLCHSVSINVWRVAIFFWYDFLPFQILQVRINICGRKLSCGLEEFRRAFRLEIFSLNFL